VEAAAKSNAFKIEVPSVPWYCLVLAKIILSAAILPCLLAGPADYEMAAIVHSHMHDKNIELYLSDKVERFEDKVDHTVVYLGSGRRLLSAAILPCLLAGPANGISAGFPLIVCITSTASPTA
jgi:hypothetical protein